MLKPDEVSHSLLSKEYVMEHGVLDTTLSDEYYTDENGQSHYERWFDKPRYEGGKPFTGIAYGFAINGEYAGYTEYKDGYQYGVDVSLYAGTGLPSVFSYWKDDEHYVYCWHQNGTLGRVYEHHRKDARHYDRSKEYDETGRMIRQRIECELHFTYDFSSPDPKYEVSWHENGEFRLVRNISPTRNDLYSEMEFDENGYPVSFTLNPHYAPESLSADKNLEIVNSKLFCDRFRIAGDVMQYRNDKGGWHPFSGKICYRDQEGCLEKLMEYKEGYRYTAQYLYYANGNLREYYCISDGKEYNHHFWWYPEGILKKAVLYSCDCKHKHTVEFDEYGNVILDQDDDM